MDEIAARAGFGIATIHRHFPKRIDLLEAVHREDLSALVEFGEELLDEPDAWDSISPRVAAQ